MFLRLKYNSFLNNPVLGFFFLMIELIFINLSLSTAVYLPMGRRRISNIMIRAINQNYKGVLVKDIYIYEHLPFISIPKFFSVQSKIQISQDYHFLLWTLVYSDKITKKTSQYLKKNTTYDFLSLFVK